MQKSLMLSKLQIDSYAKIKQKTTEHVLWGDQASNPGNWMDDKGQQGIGPGFVNLTQFLRLINEVMLP